MFILCSLDAEEDPLCALLIIDYFAIRAGDYQFLLELFNQWDVRCSILLQHFLFHSPLSHTLEVPEFVSASKFCILSTTGYVPFGQSRRV